MTKPKTKPITVEWTELHEFAAEVEIPAYLSTEKEAIEWLIRNMDRWGIATNGIKELNTDFDSFTVEDGWYFTPWRGRVSDGDPVLGDEDFGLREQQ